MPGKPAANGKAGSDSTGSGSSSESGSSSHDDDAKSSGSSGSGSGSDSDDDKDSDDEKSPSPAKGAADAFRTPVLLDPKLAQKHKALLNRPEGLQILLRATSTSKLGNPNGNATPDPASQATPSGQTGNVPSRLGMGGTPGQTPNTDGNRAIVPLNEAQSLEDIAAALARAPSYYRNPNVLKKITKEAVRAIINVERVARGEKHIKTIYNATAKPS
ncbi:hypothetical protein WJX72_011747 [[Myrmecia] bisecta]